MILVTGGLGYIGSHCLVALISAGYELIVIDNLSNSSLDTLKRVQKIIEGNIIFVEGDIRDETLLNGMFDKYPIDSVIHFAGLKAVAESVVHPMMYYENNVFGSMQLLHAMKRANVKSIVFSSSATVYGDPVSLPLRESMPTGCPTNPYGRSKLMVEGILGDLFQSDSEWNIVCLRYFNPVGAHESGVIGESPNGRPNNLMPYISQTAIGKQSRVLVFGDDYDTPDGTGVRDYIHVVDLAEGHVLAVDKVRKDSGFLTVNLGTGVGHSVLETIRAFETASGKSIKFEVVGRRQGDVAECYADPSYAEVILGWKAKKTLLEMCQDSWRWQANNPES